MKLLEAKNLIKSYGTRRVVNSVALEVNEAEVVGLLGPNGAGKTTTFYMVVGLVKPDSGEIEFKGKNIAKAPVYKRARLGMGYLSQEPSVFGQLTVEQNIMAIIENTNISRSQRKNKFEELVSEFGIEHLARSKAYQLSGGERRRLEIARALVVEPSLILLDEPFSGVDPIAVFEIQEIVKKLKAKGIGILLTDHSVRETLEITDRAYIMAEGNILIHGTAEELINNPKARQVYLGERFKM